MEPSNRVEPSNPKSAGALQPPPPPVQEELPPAFKEWNLGRSGTYSIRDNEDVKWLSQVTQGGKVSIVLKFNPTVSSESDSLWRDLQSALQSLPAQKRSYIVLQPDN